MNKKSFFNRQSTAIALLTNPRSVEEAMALSRQGEYDGADGIALELCDFPVELRSIDNFRRIFSSAQLPFMVIDYRNDVFLGADDEARQQHLLTAAEAGAEVIDVMGDLYCPSRHELAFDPEAVSRQKELIEAIHARGAKVVMSSHMPDFRNAEEVLAHLREESSRGADLLKIVTGVNSELELLEALRTTMLLNRTLDKPFIHLVNGSHAGFHRFAGLKLGVAVEFAVSSYSDGHPYFQPLISAMRQVEDNLHWDINNLKP